MGGNQVAMGPCFLHGGLFAFDPERVQTIWIDPQTGNPPDVDPATGAPLPPGPLVDERMTRSRKEILCPACCAQLNEAARRLGYPAHYDETDTAKEHRT